MDTVMKFDRVILMKEMGDRFSTVGQVYEVANILNGESFLLRDAKTKIASGVISIEDFDKHFVIENECTGWTPWQKFVGFDGQSDCLYRTNFKKVQVMFLTDKVRAEACCSKNDEFNLSFGIKLCYLRALNKARAKQKKELEEKLSMVNREIAENEKTMKFMLNSLDK